MKVYVADKDIHPAGLTLLKEKGIETTARKAEADILFIRTKTKTTRTYLQSFKKLRVLLRCGTGLDNVDIDTCTQRGIEIYTCGAANANAVAEFTLALMLNGLRHVNQADAHVRKGKWDRFTFKGSEIKGKVLGLVGMGHIGLLVVEKVKSLGLAKVLIFDPYVLKKKVEIYKGVQKVSQLSTVLQEADIVSIHVPLTKTTERLIGRKELGMMKPGALLINTARGKIVDEKALLAALKKNKIAAALDVYPDEPKVNKQLLRLPNVMLTPHIASLTEEGDEAMAMAVVRNFLNHDKADLSNYRK